MLRGKLLIVGVAVSALAITGCSKKKENSATKFTQTPVASKPASPEKANESDDIFNEFYKDDKSSSQKDKLNSGETFTPSGASSGRTAARSASGAGFTANGRYVVQVSTIRSKALAERNLRKLEDAGYPAYIAEVQNPTPDLSGTYYRLRIGGFSSIAAARDFSEGSLVPSGYDYWIDNKSNDNVGLDAGSFGNSGDSYQNSSYDTPSSSTSSSSEWESGSSVSSTPATSPSTSSTPEPAATTAPSDEKTDNGWGTNGW